MGHLVHEFHRMWLWRHCWKLMSGLTPLNTQRIIGIGICIGGIWMDYNGSGSGAPVGREEGRIS